MRRRDLCLLGAFSAVGCAAPQQSGSGSTAFDHQKEYRGPLVDPSLIPGDFMWEQRVTAIHGSKKGSFDAVLQKKGSELLVLGLTPIKTRGFALTQKGTEFEYEQFVPFDLPFNPGSVLFDIHRAFFYGLLKDFPQSSERKSRFEEESIVDQFHNRKLVRRRFHNVAGSDDDLMIEYLPAGYTRGVPPEITKIHNYAYEYELRVVTGSTQAI